MNNNEPLVSVIMPCYNSERFIQESINSIINQYYNNWELIIVDDCSSDNSVIIVNDIIQSNLDKKIKLIQLKKNSGAAIARNTAIEVSQGKYIAFLDSDDIWYPNKLSKQVKFMEKNNYLFTYTNYDILYEGGSKGPEQTISAPQFMTYKGLLKNTAIGCLTVMLNKEKLGDIRMPNIRAGQDTAFWLSILKEENIAYNLNEILSSYRIVKGSLSNNKLKALKRTWNIYRNVEKFNIIKSFYYFNFYFINAIRKRVNKNS